MALFLAWTTEEGEESTEGRGEEAASLTGGDNEDRGTELELTTDTVAGVESFVDESELAEEPGVKTCLATCCTIGAIVVNNAINLLQSCLLAEWQCRNDKYLYS